MSQQGYCNLCLKDGSHKFLIRWPILRLLHRCTFGLRRSTRWGSWYCTTCDHHTYSLRPCRGENGVPITEADPAVHEPSVLFEKNETPPEQNATEEQHSGPVVAEPVTNVLRTDQSLVARKSRATRYSEKYREGVIQRLLTGKATMLQIREELNLAEADVIDWLAESFRKKDERIEELLRRGRFDDGDTMETSRPEPVSSESIIDGAVHRRP